MVSIGVGALVVHYCAYSYHIEFHGIVSSMHVLVVSWLLFVESLCNRATCIPQFNVHANSIS